MPLHTVPDLQRRALLLGAGASALFAGCGGGGSGGTDTPTVDEFSADRTSYFVGEQAQLRVGYRGGAGRLEPGGPVASGALVTTPPLDSSRPQRLVVEAPGRPSAVRELQLPVRFRDRWQTIGSYTLSNHASVSAADGSVVVLGGSRGERVLSNAVDRFDPATRRITRIGAMGAGRSGHSALRLAGGRILVAGGVTSENVPSFAELVDETSGTTSFAGSLVQTRNWHAATVLADGRVLLVGGNGRDSAEIWDPETSRWRLLPSRLAHDRQYPSATLLPDGRVLVAGGRATTGFYVFAELFDPRTEIFTPLPGGSVWQRQLHSAFRSADGSVLIFGGESFDGGTELLAGVLRFDPVAERFDEMPALATPRSVAAGVQLPDGEVLLFGGQVDGAQPASGSAAAWRNDAQRALATMPGARLWHTAHRLPDGRLLVIGGDDGRGNFASSMLIYE